MIRAVSDLARRGGTSLRSDSLTRRLVWSSAMLDFDFVLLVVKVKLAELRGLGVGIGEKLEIAGG